MSWLLSNNRLEKVPFVSVPHTSSNRLLLSNQDKGCTPSVAHSLALPLGRALLNLWTTSDLGINELPLIIGDELPLIIGIAELPLIIGIDELTAII